MIIDRTHVRWGIGTVIATLVVTALYLSNNDPDEMRKWNLEISLPAWLGPVPPLRSNIGATPLGLIYGTIALAIFIFAALLGWRRNRPSQIGSIQAWLRAHIWLTLFTIPLVLFHCGFNGGGGMTQFLMGLYAFVMVSGLWGLALQNLIPHLMREYLPEEVIFEQIPFIRGQLVEQAEVIRQKFADLSEESAPEVELHGEGSTATVSSGLLIAVKAVKQFIDDDALPYLRAVNTRRFALREKQRSDSQFRLLKLQVPESIHPLIEDLQNLCDEKRRLDLQTFLHYLLHSWLIFHAPASILLIALTIVHAVIAVYIYS